MDEMNRCHHCGSLLKNGEGCGCPGAVRDAKKLEMFRERIADEVHIRLDKLPGKEDYQRDIRASGTAAVINGLAILMMETAYMIQQPLDKVYAVVATVLFTPDPKEGEV